MSQEDLHHGAMAAAAPDPDQPPDWVKMMLECQNKNNEHLQKMMAPILNHIAGSTQAPQTSMSTAPRWDTRESSQSTVRERRTPYCDSPFPLENPERTRNITSGPFAAELEVIQQRARASGPTRAPPSIETSVRHRNSERGSQLMPPTYTVEQRHSILPQQGQPIPQESPRAKLAIFDGNGDWESFLVPFERQARKYGWTGAHRVDYLHECLRGAAIKYVCSLPEHIREDYTLLKEQLTQRFGQRDPPTTIRRKLGELRQFKESAAEFAEEVQRLVTLAYPGVELDLQDQLATDFFLKGLRNQKVAYEVMNRDPHSLVEAQRLVEAHEHNYRATMGRDVDAKNRARRISWADDNEVSSETLAASRRVQSPTYVTADQLTLLSQKTAFLTETVERISKNYVTADQFQLLMEKMEQLQSKLDNAVAKEPRKLEDANQERRRGRSPIQSGATQTKSYSPSPSRVGTGLCYQCGEEGHFRRECVRLSTPPRNSSPSSKEQNRTTAPRDLVSWRSQSPTPQVGRTASRGPSLLIDANVNSIPVKAVVDTGAEATVISESLYHQFPLNKQTALTQACLHNAESGNDMSAKGGLKVKFQIGTWSAEWEVFVAPIRDSVLLGLDILQAANVTIHSSGRVFIEEELVPAKIVGGDGADYHVARVVLETDTMLPPESECLVWGEVDNPKPGVSAVLEPYLITETVASGSVVTTMEQRVIVRLYNLSSNKTTLLKGACLGLLVETYPDESSSHYTEQEEDGSIQEQSDDTIHSELRRLSTATDLPEHLQALYAASSGTLNEEQQQRLVELLLSYRFLFAISDDDLGFLTAVTHKINTGAAGPVRQPVRRTPLGFQGEEEKHLKAMLEAGVVTPSSSEWASPVVLVRKKDGGVRWCVDYRRLNSLTIKDAYPLPKIEECLDVLGGACVFSTLDLQSGYWQIAVDEMDRAKTAFITRYGLYEYTRMPFGLCNAPSTFQRAMELVLRGLQWETLLIYLDDIIILGKGVDESLDRLTVVFQRLDSYGLKLKPSKCHLLKDEVLFLGHVVSGEGIRPNPALVKDVDTWKTPTSVHELKAFLGLCNYYRKFVPAFSELASPLNELLRKEATFAWTGEHQNAFTQLKKGLTSAPILGYPSTEGIYILDTDASNHSIGAVLSQLQWGEERVITYASNHLTPAQKRYCVTRRELLAVVCYTRQFRHYLLGKKFLLRTDHNSLTWLFRFKHPEGQLARWLEELSQYDFDIEHRAGKHHSNADAMSRRDDEIPNRCNCYQAGRNVLDLPCGGCQHCQKLHDRWERFEEDVDDVVPLAIRRIERETPKHNDINEHNDICAGEGNRPVSELLGAPHVNWLETTTKEQLAQEQKADPDLSILHEWKENGTLPTKEQVALKSPAVRKYWLCWPQVELHQGVLFYCWERPGGLSPSLLLLVPASMQTEVLQACHNPPQSGHLGEGKTLERLRQSFHWYGMGGDVHLYIQRCKHCNACKFAGPTKRAKLQNYQAGAPMDRIHIDILGPFPVSSSGNKYVLVIIDQFTRWVEAFPIPDQGAETTARTLVYEFISRFGSPLELHTDQGRNFESSLFKNVCGLLQITKTRTTPYHPASNGQVERFNRTLLQMIRCYVNQNQKNWDEHLPLLTSAYRSSQHAVTGFTPNRLMLGREVYQPQDLWSGIAEQRSASLAVPDFLYNLEKGLREAHDAAREHLRTAQQRQKKTYDLRSQERTYNVGDLVYMRDSTKKKGQSPKLQAPWKGPFVISACCGPVLYEVQGLRYKRIMHHDRLKPYDCEVIPAWVKRQRSQILQKSNDSTDNPTIQEPLPEPEQLATQYNSETDSVSSDPEPKENQDKGRKRQPAARRRRQKQKELGLMSDLGPEEIIKRTNKGREIRKPARYNN